MSNKEPLALPDFIESIEARHPGVELEYRALKALARPLFSRPESDEFKHAIMLQSGIAWQHYNAVILLLANGFGIQGLVLCRTLFETVVGTLYLIKNPRLLAEFMDHGKLLFYEQCLASGFPTHELVHIAPECEAIRARQKGKRRSWHGGSIKSVASAVGFGETYDLLYPDASGATHADATKTLSHGSRGWRQSLESFKSEKEADIVRYNSFFLTAYLLYHVNKDLEMGHDKEGKALLILMNERAKAAAMPN